MGAKYFVVNDCSDRKTIENIGKDPPQPEVVPTLDLVVEAVEAVDALAFVVATEQEEVLGIFDFVSQK